MPYKPSSKASIKTLEGALAANFKACRGKASFSKYSDDEIGQYSVGVLMAALRFGILELYYIDGQIATRSTVPDFTAALLMARAVVAEKVAAG